MLEQFEQRRRGDILLLENLLLRGRVSQTSNDDVNKELVHGQLGHLRVGETPGDGAEKVLAGLSRQLLHDEGSRTTVKDGVAPLKILV